MNDIHTKQLLLDEVSVVRSGKTILDAVSLQIDAGEFTAIIGPNGAGKTSLLRAIAGLDSYSGHISINGRDVHSIHRSERSRLVSYLPQNCAVEWALTVRDVIALGRAPHGAFLQSYTLEDEMAIALALKKCGLESLAARASNTLSGGELARALIARTFATDAQILLADEPTNSLDPRHRVDTMTLIREYVDNGRICIAVTHDLDLAMRLADRIIVMNAGVIVAQGDSDQIFSSGVLDDVFEIKFNLTDIAGHKVLVATGR